MIKKIAEPSVQRVLHLIVLATFIGIAYYPTLDVPFIFDDYPNIVANPAVHPENFRELGKALDSPVSGNRPLSMLSLAVNYLIGGLDVYGYHLFNILLHILNGLLLYTLLTIFPHPPGTLGNKADAGYSRQNLAFWTAALWALNPVQSQAVTYIVQRMTSMATFFYLAALYFFIRWRDKSMNARLSLVLIGGCFILGMASKEIVITLPLALVLLNHLCFPTTYTKKHLVLAVAVLAVMSAICLPHLGGRLPDWFTTYPDRNFSPWERLMSQWRIIWHYLSLYFLPLPGRLHLAYDPVVSTGLLTPWTTLAGLLAMPVTWFIAWRFRVKSPAAAFGVLFFFLASAVESSFINIELAFIHRLYLPTTFLVFALLAAVPPKFIRKAGVALVLVLAVWSFWTITRNSEWNQSRNFWASDLKRGAAPARALNNRAASLIDAGKYAEAIPLIREGLRSASAEDRMILLYNLGFVYFYRDQLDEALAAFETIAAEFGDYRNTYLFIGQILIARGEKNKAGELAQQLLVNPETRYQGIIVKANLKTEEEDYEAAEALLVQTIKEEPGGLLERHLKLRLELGRVYLLQGKAQRAYETYQEIIAMYPQQYFAWRQLYHLLAAKGDAAGAEKIRRFLETKGVSVGEAASESDDEKIAPARQ